MRAIMLTAATVLLLTAAMPGRADILTGIAAHYLPILQQERAAAERAQQSLGTS